MIFIACPAYGGVTTETVRSLLNETAAAREVGVDIDVAFLAGCSLITHARNQLARDFLNSGAERLVFIDADVAWEPGAVLRLVSHGKDVVGGAYPFKSEPENYPVSWLDKADLTSVDGLLEVLVLPGGFLQISRQAFEKLKRWDRVYQHGGQTFDGFFHAPIAEGRMLGEDSAFCVDWRASGGQVWLDPELTLTHVDGVRKFTGCIGSWLKEGRWRSTLTPTS